ncbi:YncE family protein [Ruegeria sp. TM1040]|uniref:YncE family protein n=1 Tax=Ruegeria sp. (strain TM1040) TaxID=292414 RepID=UPI00005536F0|nr:hypothetical protein [Ruegeria sp. TM1040]
MSDPTITPPPDAPSRQQPSTFSARGDAFFAWLVTFAAEVTTVISWVSEKVTEIAGSATAASDSAAAASTSASQAAQSALTASGAANYQGDYDAGSLYAVGESVSYTGSEFVKKTTAPAGTTPVDGTDWLEVGNAAVTSKALTLTGTSPALDLSAADFFDLTLTGDTTLSFVNPPVTGTVKNFTLKLTGGSENVGFALTSATYDGVSFSVGAQGTEPKSITFRPDGTKMFVSDGSTPDSIYQYSLSTAWDLSTASYDSASFNVTSQVGVVEGVEFSSDGTKMFVLDFNSDRVYQYTLSTAWDLSTGSYDSVSYLVPSPVTQPQGLAFNPDGTKMYVQGYGPNEGISQFTLSTAWDLSTASYDSVNFDFTAPSVSFAVNMSISSDGTKIFLQNSSSVIQYNLSTAWDLSTATYSGVSFSVSAQDTAMKHAVFKPDGTKMFVAGDANNSMFQYSADVDVDFTLTYPTIQWPGGVTPTVASGGDSDLIDFTTYDGGVVFYGTKRGDTYS